MADDEDVIYVDVVARLDEGAADEAAESLKDKFSHATDGVTDGLKGAADKIKDEFGSVGDKLKDTFGGIGDKLKDVLSHDLPKELDKGSAGGEIGDVIGDKISTSIGEKIKEKLGGAGGALNDALGSSVAKDLGKELGAQLGDGISDTLGDVLPKNISESLGKALEGALSGKQGFGKALGGAASEILHSTLKEQLGDLSGLLEGVEFAPEVALPAAAGLALLGPGGISDRIGTGLYNAGVGHVPNLDTSPSALGLPEPSLEPALPAIDVPGIGQAQPRMGSTRPIPGLADSAQPDIAPLDTGGGVPTWSQMKESQHDAFPTTSVGSANIEAGTATVEATSVSLGGVSLSSILGGGIGAGDAPHSGAGLSVGHAPGSGSAGAHPTVSTPHGALPVNALDILAPIDTGGAQHHSDGGDVTGPGPTGVDSVFAMLAPGEGVLTPSQNDAWKSLMSKGVAHFAGGTGGGDAAAPEAPSGGGGGDDSGGGSQGESVDSSSDQGGDGGAPGTVGGTEAPGSVQDAADQGQGESVDTDTDITDPAQTGIAGGTKTSKGIQDQSYGYGKGFQVTGQGLIGFAESAPGAIGSAAASGASAGPAPAGIAAGAGAAALTSLWNTIGQPELNEAITEGVKVGADLASAPSQEFAVGGENFQNWSQKLIGGEIGNVTNLINSAANTQAPLADQGTTGSAGQAAQPNGNNGTLGGQPSPQGTPGDPMHVSVVGGGPSGGDQSSSMTSVGMDSAGTS